MCYIPVCLREVRQCMSRIAQSPCPSNSMGVNRQILGHIKLDNNLDTGKIQAPTCDVPRNQYMTLARVEIFYYFSPLPQSTVPKSQ